MPFIDEGNNFNNPAKIIRVKKKPRVTTSDRPAMIDANPRSLLVGL